MPGFTPQKPDSGKEVFSIYKTDDDKRLVFGWASISITVDGEQLEDRQKDIIDPEDLEAAAYEYVLNFRDTGEEHIQSMRKKGKLVESCVFTAEKQKAIGIPPGTVPVGWWVGFKIEDDAAWQKVKNGTYRMFSIEGKASREPVEKADRPKGCGVLVIRNGKILTGTRIERSGNGRICGPGGHIEEGETPEEAAKRETEEEFGIVCRNLTPVGVLEGGNGSAIFVCTRFDRSPRTDEKEMTAPTWRTIEELKRNNNLYPAFKASLAFIHERDVQETTAKSFSEILKFNHNHDALGRFASSPGGGGKVVTGSGGTRYMNSKSYRCVGEGSDAISDYTGYAMFADDPGSISEGYGEDMYMVDHADLTDINDLKPKIAEAWNQAVEDGTIPFELESLDLDGDTVAEDFDPPDIVDGAGAWDNPDLVSWAFEQGLFDDISGVKTSDGAISWDSDKIKPTDKDADVIGEEELEKSARIAKTFEEVLKFNPFHDSRGRFASANSYTSFTTRTRDPKKQHWADMAAARLKQQAAAAPAPTKTTATAQKPAQAAAPSTPTKRQKNYDSKGFADYDDANYHQLYNRKQYFQQQQLTANQKQACQSYLEADPEYNAPYPNNLYSHSQNMNYMLSTGQQLTGKYKQTYDGLISAMHNVGHNIEVSRYDHRGLIDGLLQTVGAGSDYTKMSEDQIKQALVGKSLSEKKILSTTTNDFKNAPQSSKNVFATRAVKVIYRVKAGAKGMLPGNGPGGDLGELLLAPTDGVSNKPGKITDIKFNGTMARAKGSQRFNLPQIEIFVDIDG